MDHKAPSFARAAVRIYERDGAPSIARANAAIAHQDEINVEWDLYGFRTGVESKGHRQRSVDHHGEVIAAAGGCLQSDLGVHHRSWGAEGHPARLPIGVEGGGGIRVRRRVPHTCFPTLSVRLAVTVRAKVGA